MSGFGVWELLFIAIILFLLQILPIWLTFRFKRTHPDRIGIGCALGFFTVFAQFYPNDNYGVHCFIGYIILGVILTALEAPYIGLLLPLAAMGAIAYRIKLIQEPESLPESATE